VWCDGEHNERRIRQSLETRDWARAGRKLADLEYRLDQQAKGEAQPEPKHKALPAAVEIFLAQRSVEPSTLKKYRRILNLFSAFARARGLAFVHDWSLDSLDDYRLSRAICALSWQKELQLLRTFFEFCVDREWMDRNPAKKMKMPPDPKPKPREPYTRDEIIKIFVACETFGKRPYERLRAKAMILLMRYYGLRVSDVATLRRDRIQGDQILLHAVKNGATLWLPLYPDVRHALECVPSPRAHPPRRNSSFGLAWALVTVTSKRWCGRSRPSSPKAAWRRLTLIASATPWPRKSS
jgi:integrase